ncbi:RCC1 domain-containing protein [Microbacterium testaceum]|uniref:RCC1 domain-containing protein n=1 Tax=Microbacterium testaceum TaxID=2033 RepID=UPI00381EF5F6
MAISEGSRLGAQSDGGVSLPVSGREYGALPRRAVIAGAALAVPAVALTVSTPAWAASGTNVTLSAPNMQAPAAGAVSVTAVVTNASGQPVSGEAVSFSGPAGSTFSPSSTTTDGSGQAVSQLDLGTPWAKPGSSATVSATSGSDTGSTALTVLGSNLVVAGYGYSSTPGQSELVFPSSVVDACGMGNPSWFLVLLTDGSVWAKGPNQNGQLGDGSTTDRSTWAPVPGLSGVTQIAAGTASGYAVLSDGSVKAWGANGSGQLGIESTTDQWSPVQVSGLTSGVTQVSTGATHVLALMSDGSVKAWGNNGSGQVGDGSTTNRLSPVQVSGLTSGVTQVAGGAFASYALSSDGSVKAWGSNGAGQVGDGSKTTRRTPVQVSGLTSGVTQVTAGALSGYALSSDGSVKAWGYNGNGELGDGSSTSSTTPVRVSGLNSGVTQIGAGYASGYALLSDGAAKAWGKNDSGQLGDGSTTNRATPVSVALPSGHAVKRLAASTSIPLDAFVIMG